MHLRLNTLYQDLLEKRFNIRYLDIDKALRIRII